MLKDVPAILTFQECMVVLKVGKNTLLRLIHDGELDAFRIGNRWKITREAVEVFIEKRG